MGDLGYEGLMGKGSDSPMTGRSVRLGSKVVQESHRHVLVSVNGDL